MTDRAKPALRAELRARRDSFVLDMTADVRADHEGLTADRVLPLLAGAHVIALYIAVGAELDCAPLIARARDAGIAIALPHVTARTEPMRFVEWRDGDSLERGWAGLSQPAAHAAELSPDVIIAPLLGFDSALWRIGQGASFYDRAFETHQKARRIGLAWSVQQVAQVPRDPWDEPLHMIVTEHGIFDGTRAA